MTFPSDLPIEDRLRAHFEDRARTLELPGPEADEALARAREGLPLERRHGDDLAGRHHRRRGPLLAAAAVVAVLALVAGVALARRDDTGNVSTDPRLPSPTPTTEAEPPPTTTEPSPDTTSTTTEPAPPTPTATGPIVGLEGILGSWDGEAWVPWRSGDPTPPAQEYQVVGPGGSVASALGLPVTRGCGAVETDTIEVGFTTGEDPTAPTGVAVAGAPDLVPRSVTIVDVTDAYRQAAIDVARSLGVAQPDPRIISLVRADLEGDGSAEVVVVAQYVESPTGIIGSAGDWSVAFVRRVVGSEVRTSVIAQHRPA